MPRWYIIQSYHTNSQNWLMSAVSLDIYVLGTLSSRWYTLLTLQERIDALSSRQSSQSCLGVPIASILPPKPFFNFLISLSFAICQGEYGLACLIDSGRPQSCGETSPGSAPSNHPSPLTVICPYAEISGIGPHALCLWSSWDLLLPIQSPMQMLAHTYYSSMNKC